MARKPSKNTRRWHKAPSELRAKVLEQIAAGASTSAVAIANGISPSAVFRWVEQEKQAPADKGADDKGSAMGRRYSEAKKAEILAHAATTKTLKETADKFGCTSKVIRIWQAQAQQANGHAPTPTAPSRVTNGSGGDPVAAFNRIMRELEGLSPTQRRKLLEAARSMVES